jgi:hypothetical protein
MAHLRAYHAAAGGRLPVSNGSRKAHIFAATRRLIFAAAALFAASIYGSTSYAQQGPFAGMAGTWSGSGIVTLGDGSTERIRCRATYAVGAGGRGLNLNLLCASASYKFDLRGNVISEGGAVSGSWSEAGRGVNGTLEGRGAGGHFQILATAAGFVADLSLTTRGNRQSIVIRSQSGFRSASMSLSRG